MKSKLDHHQNQMRKALHKKYEYDIISRIWHKLDDTEIKMICQQHINRPTGRALTDAYFPQLNVHIEIDESHHLNQQEADAQREADIIDATQHEIWRIPTTHNGQTLSIEDLYKRTDHFVRELKLRIKKHRAEGTFKPWSLEEHTSEYWLNKGQIHTSDDCTFNLVVEVINCFGFDHKGWQRGGLPIKKGLYKGVDLWFPKLFPNGQWFNEETGDSIKEMKMVDGQPIQHHDFANILNDTTRHQRIIFANVKDNLGNQAYRFKGLYKLNVEESINQNHLIWKLHQNSVSTYRA